MYLLHRPESCDAWRSAAVELAAATMQPRAAISMANMTVGAQERLNIGGTMLRAAALMLFVLSFPVGVLAIGTAAGLVRLPFELSLLDQRLPMLFRAHMAASGLALLLVPIAIACQGLKLHKLLGRSAALLVIAGGVTALPVAMASEASWPARIGFLAQALVWIALVLAAVRAIRAAERMRHMWLMLAVAAVASAALWLRLASWIAVKLGLPFETVYACAAWLSWSLPLAAIGLLARWRGALMVRSKENMGPGLGLEHHR
jgi:Predicted membrane protein (DUF2306)